jgi:hypothetical protein
MKHILIALGLGSYCLLPAVLVLSSTQEAAANAVSDAVPSLNLPAVRTDLKAVFPEAAVTLEENTIQAEFRTELRTLTRPGAKNTSVIVKIRAPKPDGFMIWMRFGVGSTLDEPIVRSGALTIQRSKNSKENDYYFTTAEADIPGEHRYVVVQIRYGDSIDIGRVKAAYQLLQQRIPGLPKLRES